MIKNISSLRSRLKSCKSGWNQCHSWSLRPKIHSIFQVYMCMSCLWIAALCDYLKLLQIKILKAILLRNHQIFHIDMEARPSQTDANSHKFTCQIHPIHPIDWLAPSQLLQMRSLWHLLSRFPNAPAKSTALKAPFFNELIPRWMMWRHCEGWEQNSPGHCRNVTGSLEDMSISQLRKISEQRNGSTHPWVGRTEFLPNCQMACHGLPFTTFSPLPS